jgi:hypothetical protein
VDRREVDRGEEKRPRTASVTLPPDLTSPRSARELLRLLGRSWHVPTLDDADLLLTEVVTLQTFAKRTDLRDAEPVRKRIDDRQTGARWRLRA